MLIQLPATWIPALLIALSGALKFSGNPEILETMTALGVGRHVRLLGLMELAFAALFVVPATMKLGCGSRALLLRRSHRDRTVARRVEGQSLPPDRAVVDRRVHPQPIDLSLRHPMQVGTSDQRLPATTMCFSAST
jgi:hypothetical protein